MNLLGNQELVKQVASGSGFIDFLTLKEKDNPVRIQVYDANGRSVKKIELSETEDRFKIDTTDLIAGVYIVQARSYTKSGSLKFFVN